MHISNVREGAKLRSVPEPIAIIGMGLRYAGASDVESFWRLLSEGRESVGAYPGGRFPFVDDVYSAHPTFAQRIKSPRGGFISHIDLFDADFFRISRREATLLDPQQRLLLEVAWEAIDDAGLVREHLIGTQTGVFVGLWTSDYEDCLNDVTPKIDLYQTTGTGRYGASGRLAFVLDVRGPNLTIDTACSSSLVAVHLACQSLRAGESTLALAGGANLILRPEITLAYSDAGVLSPDGRCKFADASADGYVRSEGAGIVALKRLSDAITDGDSIYGVIRGSAVNNNGRLSGQLVAPSTQGQEEVIRTALEYAGVDATDVGYVEAHGTGTRVGDPIEIEAIARVIATPSRRFPCAIGSIKTNIGHTEAAAGVAGLMKAVLAVERGVVPASLHLREPNPNIAWSDLPIVVPTETMAWPGAKVRQPLPIAGVMSFGITGTNAHAVVQAIASETQAASAERSTRPLVFALSAQTPAAVRAVASSWIARMESDASWPEQVADLAYTAAVRHTHHDERIAVIALNRDELIDQLRGWLNADAGASVVAGRRVAGTSGKAVFVYPGQGGQWLGMGRVLLDREPVFREALLRCDAAIARHVGWHVVDELGATPAASRLDEIDVVQPTLFAVMIALTELVRSLGVEPAAVIGHSMGEAAAAFVAGALSLDDAAAVICHRSRLMKSLRGHGAMAVVELSLEDARTMIAGADNVWIGASNGARSTVISGDVDAIEAMLVTLEARDVFCRRIKVDVASHSGHMDAVRDDLEAALAGISPRAGALPIYSTTTGEIENGTRLDAAYWAQNLRQPVLFHGAVAQLLEDGFDAFVEINTHPVLTHSLSESVDASERDAVVTGTLRRDSNEQMQLLSAVAALHVAGFPVDWRRSYPSGRSLRLPAYPWQRERYWFDAPRDGVPRRAGRTAIEGVGSFNPADCLTEIEWTDAPTPASDTKAEISSAHWIVFDDGGVGSSAAAHLVATGDTCTIVRPGSAFRAIDATTFEIDPQSDDDLRRVLTNRLSDCRGIIHAWAAQASDHQPDIGNLWSAQDTGCLAVASLVRVLAKLASPEPPRLWLVTSGLHQASNAESMPFPTHGAVAGLSRAIAREHPELSCTHLDLSSLPSGDEIDTAVTAIREAGVEQQMLIRGSRRFAARYRRANTLIAPTATAISSNATYLITGGLGGVARHVARWLVSQGARSLVLTGRNAPNADAARVIADLEGQGATIRVVLGDLANADHAAKVVAAAREGTRPLKGIFHLAAVVDDRLLINTPAESYHQLLRPKMAAAWNLHRAIADHVLDFWISFSSIAAVVSQPGQGSYAAANAFLDGLARYASARGQRMQSLQWGPWGGTGLANEEGTQRSFRVYADEGIRTLTSAEGVSILEHAMRQAAPVALAAAVDWTVLAAAPAEYAIASEFRSLGGARVRTAAPAAAEPRASEPDLQDQLRALSSQSQRLALLEAHLRDQLAIVLRTSAQRIDPKKPMGNLGVDSLMALEFVRRLSRSTGIKLPATAVFNYPTVATLAKNIEARLDSVRNTNADDARGEAVAPAVVASDGELAAMSDDDALRALVGESREGR